MLRTEPMLFGVSKDIRREIRATLNRNFASVILKLHSVSEAKMEDGDHGKEKRGFWRKRIKFRGICQLCIMYA
ncbi:unnamed protein product [Gongylonema pulchrum]|uniref:Ovule protein n=1 Tax=Gongylonema pulchrum TaxID=637853 RepID=A0A183DMZ1_9BILA|nr:unnamed protein product [Gongylonema pulchrum]